jgi:hypothetical protein
VVEGWAFGVSNLQSAFLERVAECLGDLDGFGVVDLGE